MSLTSVDLPDPETPVTAISVPSGKSTVMSRRLCSRAPTTVSLRCLFDPAAGCSGSGISRLPDRNAPVIDPGDAHQVVDRAGHHDVAAVLARARTDVDHPVGGADGVLVVLDDDQRVAEVAQPGQRLDQPVVVPLVQADRRLVQHVQHADQAGADLRGQPDPLRLAAGQRGGRPVEGQVVEPDVEQEPEPGVDLLQHPLGDHPVALGQHQPGEERRRRP